MRNMMRKLLFRKPPDGLIEISDRVYVFNCCYGAQHEWSEHRYRLHVEKVVRQFRKAVPEASLLVCNFRDEENRAKTFNALSDVALADYPRQHLGCSVLKTEDTWRFLRSCESWLSRGCGRDVVLMHCEGGAWPVLAFALAALLVFRKQCEGEKRALDTVYELAPRQLLHSLMAVNQIPSQLRYLRYVATCNRALDSGPPSRVVRLDCVVLRFMPKFGDCGACGGPAFRVYGRDPFIEHGNGNSKLLCSTKIPRDCEQRDCDTVKVHINCHIKGDVLIESINLDGDTQSGQIMFRVMFNAAFMESNFLLLNRDKIDVLWWAKDHFPKDFRAEILFSEMDASTANCKKGTSCFEQQQGYPIETFSKLQEDPMNPVENSTLNVLKHKGASPNNTLHEKSNTDLSEYVEGGRLMLKKGPQIAQQKKNEENRLLSSNMENQVVISAKQSSNNHMSNKEDKTNKAYATLPRSSKSGIIRQETPDPFGRTSESGNCETDRSDLKIKVPSDSADTSSSGTISPQTPSPLPPLTRSVKEIHDSHPHKGSHLHLHHHLPSKAGHLTEETKSQSQGRSQSCTFSSRTGTPVSSTSQNKSLDDSSSNPLASAITSNQPPSLNKILPMKTKVDSSPIQPQTPPHPTPALKEHEPITARPDASPTTSPTPPVKKHEPNRARPHAFTPTTPLKNHEPIKAIPHASPETPPTPPIKEHEPIRERPHASPSTLQVKEHESIRERLHSFPSTPSTPPLKEHEQFRSRLRASSPTPPLKEHERLRSSPSTPPTPPLKEHEAITARHLASPPTPPTPPLKEHETIRSRLHSSPPTPPTPPLKEHATIRARLHSFPPTPHTPPLKEHEPNRVGAPTSPPTPPPNSKDERQTRSGTPALPPSPPPPPCPSKKIPSPPPFPSIPQPPPPPTMSLSSDHSNSSLQKSPLVPAAPPPPGFFGRGGIQADNGFTRSLSMGAGGHNVSSTGNSCIGSKKGRNLSHSNSMNQTKKLKPLHWLKLSRAVQGSLWAETQKSGEDSKAPEIDMSELESLFSAAVPSSGPSRKTNVKSSVAPKSDKVQLVIETQFQVIDHTRAYNCEIVLSKVKVPLHDLMRSVLALEESALDIDQVENLIKFCPTKEEIEVLKEFLEDEMISKEGLQCWTTRLILDNGLWRASTIQREGDESENSLRASQGEIWKENSSV
ncbi:hypothetical protein Fmac_026557 [Flemingia macrophylla]|uniref:Formin-like protein n=1 Tax=Flemingia macrophylla TaxID=520843 RepID=A0ABD1LFG3_9FABA